MTTQLKLSTHSTYSTKSHSIYLGYLQQKLLSIDYTQTANIVTGKQIGRAHV